MTKFVPTKMDNCCPYCRREIVGAAHVENLQLVHQECVEGWRRGIAARIELEKEKILEEEARKQRLQHNSGQIADNERRSSLLSDHPEHICGMYCDGQDGSNSDCARLRRKLGFK